MYLVVGLRDFGAKLFLVGTKLLAKGRVSSAENLHSKERRVHWPGRTYGDSQARLRVFP